MFPHHTPSPTMPPGPRTFGRIMLSVATLFVLLTCAVTAQQNISKLTPRALRQALAAKNARIEAEAIARANKMPMRVERADGSITEIQSFDNGIPRAFQTENLKSAKTISSYRTWTGKGYGFSLSGLGDTLGEWDGGAVRTTHQEFGGRVISTEGASAEHSTHVAGTMIAAGVDSNAHGMSYQAKLKSFDWNSDVIEMANAALAGMQTSNHSYGLITGWSFNYFNDSKWVWFGDTTVNGLDDYRFGLYDAEAESWDGVAQDAPNYLICKAAGNDRGEGPGFGTHTVHWIFTPGGSHVLSNTDRNRDGGTSGYNTVQGGACSKNIMTVGAVSAITTGWTKSSDVLMSSFSCWGPTDDGRIKPDIVADGVNLYSTTNTGNANYATLSGTSMATPSVTGSIGLLLENQRNLHGSQVLRAATLKALITHTADEAGNTGPDYVYGWGLMNTLKACQLMRLDSADGSGSHIAELTLVQGGTILDTIYSDGITPLRVTISWTDPAHAAQPKSLNPTSLMLINDLDLRLISESNVQSMPWVLNPASPSSPATTGDNVRDNIEQVYIAAPEPGRYIVSITHKATLSGGSQKVSLVMSGNVMYHLAIANVASSPSSYPVNPGVVSPESIKVKNTGNNTLTYTLTATQPWLQVSGTPVDVGAQDSAYIHFAIDATALSQWSSYSDTISFVSNDSVHLPILIPVTAATRGPKIVTQTTVSAGVDSGQTLLDTLWIHNAGTTNLTISNSIELVPSAPWLSLLDLVGSIAPGDSARLRFSIDATTLTAGVHSASVKSASNDSSTGDVFITLNVTVYRGITVPTSVSSKWNLVSLPATVSDRLKSHLYPAAISPAYNYDGSYHVRDTIEAGTGYWLKFGNNQNVDIHGLIIDAMNVPVLPGWNLIGSITFPVAPSQITSTPPGMITGNFFGYANGYTIADSLRPGLGYWVNVADTGSLTISWASVAPTAGRIRIVPSISRPPAPPESDPEALIIPDHYRLDPAYPNPFNPGTNVNYALPVSGYVTIKVFNILGEEVATIADGYQDAGYKSIRVDMNGRPSGVYFVRMVTESFTQSIKLMLMK